MCNMKNVKVEAETNVEHKKKRNKKKKRLSSWVLMAKFLGTYGTHQVTQCSDSHKMDS